MASPVGMAMPPIFPAPPSNNVVRPSPPRDPHGFTLIETVVALALCALVAGAVASSLSTALGAERQAVLLREQRRMTDALQQALALPDQMENVLAPWQQDWETASAPQTTGEGTNLVRWTVWEVSRLGQSSRRSYLAVRAP